MNKEILILTIENVPGRTIEKSLGTVRGNTVRARNFARNIGAAFKSFVGGEIKTYTEMVNLAREEALNRMINSAIDLGADAVVGVRFMTSMIMPDTSEVLVYGTAVKLNN